MKMNIMNENSNITSDGILKYHHYITVENGLIICGYSVLPGTKGIESGDICIRENGNYQFTLFLNGEDNPILFTNDHIPLYKWNGNEVVHRSPEEIQADRDKIPVYTPEPTEMEKLRADLDYVMLMSGLDVSET